MVDGDDVRRITGRKLRRQLVVTRPFDRGHAYVHVRIVGIELVDQRRDDAAFPDGLADVGIGAELRVAGAEKALHGELRCRKGRRRCGKGQH